MTGQLSGMLVSRMFHLGVRGYLVKPLDEDDIRRHLTFHSAHRAV